MYLPPRLTMCAAFLSLFPLQARAQTFWQQTNGPLGGIISGLAPTPSGSLLALTDYSAMFQLDPVTFRWEHVGTSLPKSPWYIISGRPREMYAFGRASPNPHFYRSTDGGTTWDSLTHLFPPHDNDEGGSLLGIWAWPNGALVYRTSWWRRTYMRSTDQGNSWLDYPGTHPEFVAGNGSDTLYGASSGSYPLRTGRVFRSTDAGLTWIGLGSNQLLINIRSLWVDPGGRIFLGTETPGLLRSADGATWDLVSGESHTLFSFTQTPDGSLFWLDETSTIHRSTDNGSTWIVLSGNLPPPPYEDMISAGPGGTVFIATRGGRMYRADAEGRQWTETNAGLAGTTITTMASGKNGTIVGLTDRTAFTSLENGTGWRVNGLENVGGQRVVRTETGALVALTNGSPIARSTDGGDRWDSVSIDGPYSRGMIDLALGPGRRIVALGPQGAGILSSVDDGRTWSPIGTPPSTRFSTIAIASSLDGSMYVSSSDWNHPLVRSTDLGTHWEAANSGIPLLSYIAMLRGDSHGHVWAAGEGLYRLSTSNSWEPSASGITHRILSSLYPATWGTLYGGTADGGVFQSTDLGATWSALPSELQRATVTCFAEDSRGFLYAGTKAHGIFRSVGRFGDTTTSTSVPPDVVSLRQNYPNPFNAGTAIRFAIPHSGWAALKIFNVLGGEVAVVHEGPLPATEHQFTWDGAGQPGGVYFCRLQTEIRTLTRKMLLIR